MFVCTCVCPVQIIIGGLSSAIKDRFLVHMRIYVASAQLKGIVPLVCAKLPAARAQGPIIESGASFV